MGPRPELLRVVADQWRVLWIVGRHQSLVERSIETVGGSPEVLVHDD